MGHLCRYVTEQLAARLPERLLKRVTPLLVGFH
jgi:hypothetical protein